MADVKHFDPDTVLDTVVGLFWRHGAASTGIQDIVTATGVNRSSLYSTFGGKQDLYLAALRRYVDHRSRPVFQRLTEDERGVPAIADFFARLIDTRCTGEHARWGCMISNAHAGTEHDDPQVRQILNGHHDQLRAALRTALKHARDRGQLQPGVALEQAADLLAMLAYGVNLRSRAGADPRTLTATVTATLATLSASKE